MTRAFTVGHLAYNGQVTFTRRVRIAIQRRLVRRTHRRACRAYDRLVDLENP